MAVQTTQQWNSDGELLPARVPQGTLLIFDGICFMFVARHTVQREMMGDTKMNIELHDRDISVR